MPEVIADTSPIQYLFQINLLDLLPALYGRVMLPQAVARELSVGLASGTNLPDITLLPWAEIIVVAASPLPALPPNLGLGEQETLALAMQTPNSLALLDDALARRYARLLKINFTGTLGVLLKAKEAGHLKGVKPAIDQLESVGFRLAPVTRLAVLRLADE